MTRAARSLSPSAPRLDGARSVGAAACRGVAQTLGVVAATLALGLGAAAFAPAAGAGAPRAPGPAAYTAALMADEGPGSTANAGCWLVDGFNVLHAGLLRGGERQAFWREELRARLLERAGGFDDPAAELWIVFDGPEPAPAEAPAGRLHVVFAASADDWLLRRVREAERPERLTVVTADRKLASRARHRGARVVAPRAFLARCAPGTGEDAQPS